MREGHLHLCRTHVFRLGLHTFVDVPLHSLEGGEREGRRAKGGRERERRMKEEEGQERMRREEEWEGGRK